MQASRTTRKLNDANRLVELENSANAPMYLKKTHIDERPRLSPPGQRLNSEGFS